MSKLRKKVRLGTLLMLIMSTMFITMQAFTVNVYAGKTADGVIKEYVKENATVSDSSGNIIRDGSKAWKDEISGYFTTKVDGSHKIGVSATEKTHTTKYYYAESDETAIKEKITNVKTADEIDNQVDDITGGLNVYADTASGTQVVSGVVPLVNLLVGVVLLLITLFLTLYSASDISFLAFPIVREKLMGQLEQGQSNAMIKVNKEGQAKYRWVTDDAVGAYEESVVNGSKKNPYLKYFSKRTITYVCIGLLTFVLLTGKVGIFTSIGIKLGKGIINLLAGL